MCEVAAVCGQRPKPKRHHMCFAHNLVQSTVKQAFHNLAAGQSGCLSRILICGNTKERYAKLRSFF